VLDAQDVVDLRAVNFAAVAEVAPGVVEMVDEGGAEDDKAGVDEGVDLHLVLVNEVAGVSVKELVYDVAKKPHWGHYSQYSESHHHHHLMA